jgi:16S rRNA (cytosine967-C5)-methyltransferase
MLDKDEARPPSALVSRPIPAPALYSFCPRMPISRARTIAFDVLLRVAKQDAYADEALRAELASSVKAEDAGLATELVLGVLRWQRLLDFMIDRQLKKPASTADIEVRIALRLGAYQLLFLDRIPARAAVHESVELVKRARKRSAASLVNAVLRKFAAGARPERMFVLSWARLARTVAPLLPDDMPPAEREGILASHPTWLVERWLQTFGEGRTRAILADNNRVPAVSGRVPDTKHSEDAARSLQNAGCRILPGRLLRDAWVIEGGNAGASEAVRHGWVALQDEASQAVAGLVAADPGNSVLDLCAAPGGKTLILSRAVGPQGHVIAADLHEHRVRALRERMNLADVRNVETMVLDGTLPLPFEQPFDRILVDVPCSGTGTLARHPEIRWKLRPEDLADLHARQTLLLRNALPHLAPAGRLVYSTCSLEPEENELVVREVLGEFGDQFQIADRRGVLKNILQESVPMESVVAADGFFRTLPPQHGTDGFFAAVIERRAAKVQSGIS